MLASSDGAPDIAGMSGDDQPRWLRAVILTVWSLGWALVLWTAHRPWCDLGGIVGERLRWLERFVLAAGLVVGATLGSMAGDVTRRRRGRARAARWLLYPAAFCAAAGMAALRLTGRDDAIGVVLSGLLSYAAGALSTFLGIGVVDRDHEKRAASQDADRCAPRAQSRNSPG